MGEHMQNLQRIRAIAAHYRSLQGLRMLPWFLWILLFGAVNPALGLPQGRLDYQLLLIVPGLVVPWAVSRWIGAYYDRAFGQIEGLPPRNRALEALAGVTFVVVAFLGFLADSLQRWPVSLFGLVMAVAMFVQWWRSGRFLTHYLVTAALLAAISMLPLFGIPASGHWYTLLGGFAFPIMLGLVLSLGSVLGHILLVRSLKLLSQVKP